MKQGVKWAVALVVIGGAYFFLSRNPANVVLPVEDIIVPQFSAEAAAGEVVFNGSCAACHGVNAAGTALGPALVSKIYQTRIHADFALRAAMENGVTPHHGRYAPMPPQEQITEAEVEILIAYIRELQQANGIN